MIGKVIARLLISIVATVVAFIPLEIILISHAILQPEGFWQKLVLYGAGVYLLGLIQLFFVVGWVIGLIFLWTEWD